MNKTCLIHNNNISYEDNFDEHIKFTLGSVNIDKYISQNIIQKLKDKNYSVIHIKDNLSSNYLELYGLRVAYHIRLSSELSFKERCLPIVIISDVDIYTLNKLSPLSSILFTKNIFSIKNDINSVKNFNIEKILPFTKNEYQDKFLNKIEIEAPKETHHDIANEWAIYKWAKELNISNSDKINTIVDKLSSKLYFKYLQYKYKHSVADQVKEIEEKRKTVSTRKSIRKVVKEEERKRILLIDDEWDKGWSDIFKTIFPKEKGYNFEAIEDIVYKNKEYKDIKPKIIEKIISFNPDLIILDMRLVDSDKDHEKKTNSHDISGIKILEAIKNKDIEPNINPGIQVIMLTASGRSDILDNANKDNKILGYIKKEHPEDITIKAKESVARLAELVDEGLEKKYLKEIWRIQKNILALNILKTNDESYLKIKDEIKTVFDVLNSTLQNKMKFTLLTIFKVLELLNDIHYSGQSAVFQKSKTIFRKFGITDKNDEISKIICTRNFLMHSGVVEQLHESCCKKESGIKVLDPEKVIEELKEENILEWFNMLEKILTEIDNRQRENK